MVELGEVFPVLGGVTGLTAHCPSVTEGGHAHLEFPTVRILVAARTGQPIKVINTVAGIRPSRSLMAIEAGGCQVRPRQYKVRFLVPRHGEGRRMKINFGVALLTAIQIRCARELGIMRVFMAVRASTELNFEDRILARRRMAFIAGDVGVFPTKWESRCVVIL
jgi:hypothetical protein